MKLVFRGGLWDGVEIEARYALQEIRLSGVIVDGADHEEEPQPSLRKTVLMSKVGRHLYELEEFEGANEEVAIYLPQEI